MKKVPSNLSFNSTYTKQIMTHVFPSILLGSLNSSFTKNCLLVRALRKRDKYKILHNFQFVNKPNINGPSLCLDKKTQRLCLFTDDFVLCRFQYMNCYLMFGQLGFDFLHLGSTLTQSFF